MKRKLFLELLLGYFAILIVGVAFNVNAQTSTPGLPTYEQVEEVARQLRSWDVVMDFQFEDEKGNPLNDVLIATSVTISGGWKSKVNRSRFRAQGSNIHLEYQDKVAVRLSFSKEGHGGQVLNLVFFDPPNWVEFDLENGVQKYRKTIVLKKDGPRKARRGQITGLQSIYSGKAKVFIMTDFHLPSVSVPSEEHPWTFKGNKRGIEITSNTLVLDDPYFYLDVVNDPSEEGVYESASDFTDAVRAIVPTGKAMELGLRSNNPDDGIIMLEPEFSDIEVECSTNDLEPFPDRTKIAPESGYQERIRVPHFMYLEDDESVPSTLYFFYRVNGYYGRGKLERTYIDDALRCSASMFVEIQADGTPEIDY